jgi:cellulose synthase/poly-beta-1,6-N-acetylglucosamine synthase-like glycosyltransferase
MDLISPILLVGSLALTAHALFSLYLLLYSWEYPERLEASRGPTTQREPSVGFTILLPARHEESVIAGTINRIWAARYPRKLLQILVICHEDDTGTIRQVRRTIRKIRSRRVRLVTFSGAPVNKPRALNIGLAEARHEVIAVFDAEDDVDPDVFSIVNTVMLEEKTGIVQSGVQLMNFTDHWFAVHNCLEYFFWFKSRLHFHAKVGMIPLGGNTIFMRRDLIDRVGGWDATCLTEDADIGLRLSTLGEPIRVIYDAQHVTREETPSSVESLVRQRTRWNQGFMHVLRKGAWLELPTWQQRALAVYTFSYPLIQAPTTLIWPFAILAGLFMKVPLLVAMASFLPLYAMLFQLVLMVVGAFMFAREYGLPVPRSMPLKVALTFMPYQLILGFSAARAAYRELHHEGGWEKTEHVGAHRRAPVQVGIPPKPVVRWGLSWARASHLVVKGWQATQVRMPTTGTWARAALTTAAANLEDGLQGLLMRSARFMRESQTRVAHAARSVATVNPPQAILAEEPGHPAEIPTSAAPKPTLAETIRATMLAPDTSAPLAFAAPERIVTRTESACPACGWSMSINARFCRRCGVPSEAPMPQALPVKEHVFSRSRRRAVALSVGTVLALVATLGFFEIMLGSTQPRPGNDHAPGRDEANRPALVRAMPNEVLPSTEIVEWLR